MRTKHISERVPLSYHISIRKLPKFSEKPLYRQKFEKDYSPPSSLLLCRYLDQQVVSEQEVHQPSALNLDSQIGEELYPFFEDYIICVLSVQVCL